LKEVALSVKSSIVIAIGMVAIVGALLFPPWLYSYDAPSTSVVYRTAGYHSLFAPPIPGDREQLIKLFGIVEYTAGRPTRGEAPAGIVQMNWFSYQIDHARLAVEVLIIIAVVIGMCLIFRR
jgi:hypothetical protein